MARLWSFVKFGAGLLGLLVVFAAILLLTTGTVTIPRLLTLIAVAVKSANCEPPKRVPPNAGALLSCALN